MQTERRLTSISMPQLVHFYSFIPCPLALYNSHFNFGNQVHLGVINIYLIIEQVEKTSGNFPLGANSNKDTI